jgi:hypothetical protein
MTPAWLVLVLSAALLPQACAATPRDEQHERQRIAFERAQVQAFYLNRERECEKRFTVTACIEEARRSRREAMERLRYQDVILDEAQRRQRALQRIQDIHGKVSAGPAPPRQRLGEAAHVRLHAQPESAASAAR